MRQESVAERVREQLRGQVLRELPLNHADWMLPPLRTLATAHGASLVTVKAAVDALNAEGLLRSERGRGVTVSRKRAVELSERGQSGDIGLVFLSKFNQGEGVVADSINAIAQNVCDRGVKLLPVGDELPPGFPGEGLAGLLLLSRLPLGHVHQLLKSKVPLVWLENSLSGQPIAAVTLNKPAYFRTLAEYIRERRLERVWFFSHSLLPEDRLLFEEICPLVGIRTPEIFSKNMLCNDQEGFLWTRDSAAAKFAQGARPDLIVVNGETAISGLLAAASANGVEIPRDLPILPVVGNPNFQYRLPFQTDFILIPKAAMAAKARETLDRLIGGATLDNYLTTMTPELLCVPKQP